MARTVGASMGYEGGVLEHVYPREYILVYSEPWHILKLWYIQNPGKYICTMRHIIQNPL